MGNRNHVSSFSFILIFFTVQSNVHGWFLMSIFYTSLFFAYHEVSFLTFNSILSLARASPWIIGFYNWTSFSITSMWRIKRMIERKKCHLILRLFNLEILWCVRAKFKNYPISMYISKAKASCTKWCHMLRSSRLMNVMYIQNITTSSCLNLSNV